MESAIVDCHHRLSSSVTLPTGGPAGRQARGSDGIARSTNSVEGVALRAAVPVPVSPSKRADIYEWHSAGHPASEALFLQATTGVRHPSVKTFLSCTRVAQAVGARGRAEVLVYLRSIA